MSFLTKGNASLPEPHRQVTPYACTSQTPRQPGLGCAWLISRDLDPHPWSIQKEDHLHLSAETVLPLPHGRLKSMTVGAGRPWSWATIPCGWDVSRSSAVAVGWGRYNGPWGHTRWSCRCRYSSCCRRFPKLTPPREWHKPPHPPSAWWPSHGLILPFLKRNIGHEVAWPGSAERRMTENSSISP